MLATALLLLIAAQGAAQAAPPVVVNGCLTAATTNGQTQFTLTATDTNRAAADVKTETYQLKPKSGVDLKSLVGRRVEVTGTETPTGAETTTVDASRQTEKSTGTSGKTPTVETKTRADIVTHVMSVTSAKAVAGDCRVP
ncbi:MAG TPA: hypothetical protein VFA27_11095 [Vicinamibacterales bacterium]|nr:hypothetical protein [Vicinamibacterales bacterium]